MFSLNFSGDMSEKFARCEDDDYPLTYLTFTAKDLDSDELIEYTVEDLTVDYTEPAVDICVKFLSPDEAFNQATKVPETPSSVEAIQAFNKKTIAERLSLACFNSRTRELVGLNLLIVKSRTDKGKIEVRKHKDGNTRSFFQFLSTFRLTIPT